MEKLNDRWLRIIGILVVALVANFVFYQPDNGPEDISWFNALLISLIEWTVLLEVNRQGILLARRHFPRLNQTRNRILLELSWFVVATVLQRVTVTYLYDVTQFWGYPLPGGTYWVTTLVSFLFTLPIAAIYEGQHLYRQWWATYYEAEQLKKENLQSQLDSLKAQINPHFLFNSLSTLSSLVSEDARQAERFIEELASVYRYVLQTNEQPLTTLDNELQFIRAYFNLLQMRFGRSVELEVETDERLNGFLLPPLTLQLLVENAVKHNVALPNRPLIVRIYTDEVNNLFVVNTLRKKQNAVPSNRTGLTNITTKYRLLKQPDVVVRQTSDCFQVMIPLIEATAYEYSAHRG
ncbi:histidine kinase [Larkinella arboricola]|uniref:Histidine kinase n=1 Tax=Larkinella arboricola TaxID=643671 RepID=A0A327WNR4_LARAB|nr:sensor histidine kinase [Larkinella arboricola]RAJ93998.1 histidine kinase [Larkinella arboricola]